MRLKHIPGCEEEIAESPFVLHDPEEVQNFIKSPLYIEIGMGKGRFILENAAKYPDICFIGIEMYESVMIKATRKLSEMDAERPQNVRFIRCDAADIFYYLKPGSVDRIYLNFSDPWPKKRHAKRRLVSERFLLLFKKLLKKDAVIEFKTDNRDLFDFGLEEYEKAGYELLYKTYDLHADSEVMKDNIMTEYEQKFSEKGNKILKYVIRPVS